MMNRFDNLDWIRGLMILWMLVVHISLNYGIIKFGEPISGLSIFNFLSFFMTPFYFFSGYLMNTKRSWWEFSIHKFKKLAIPYITFTIWGIIIYELYQIIYIGHGVSLNVLNPISYLSTGATVSNSPLWFLISLLFTSIVYRKIMDTTWGGIVIVVCFIIAWLTEGRTQYLGYGNVMLGLCYMHFGYILKKYQDRLCNRQFFIISILIYVLICVFDPQMLSMVLNIQSNGNYGLNLLFSVSACYILWRLSKWFKHENIVGKSIIYIGRNSLVVFAFHRPVLNYLIEPVLHTFIPDISYGLFLSISLFILLILYFILDNLMRIYTPKLLGL